MCLGVRKSVNDVAILPVNDENENENVVICQMGLIFTKSPQFPTFLTVIKKFLRSTIIETFVCKEVQNLRNYHIFLEPFLLPAKSCSDTFPKQESPNICLNILL